MRIMRLLSVGKYTVIIFHNNTMQCPECRFRFTMTARKPIIQPCGHTVCQHCLSQLQYCSVCHEKLNKQDFKINYSLYEILEKGPKNIDKLIKLCFIGSSGVGKTSLIRMLTGKPFKKDIPTTVGYDFLFCDRRISGYNVRFQLWDSAGQEKYRAISPIHYKNAHIIVIVYSICSDAKNNQVDQWIQQAENNVPQQTQMILVGNKTDLVEGKLFKPLDESAWKKLQQRKFPQIQTSCKNNVGLQEFWNEVEKNVSKERQFELPDIDVAHSKERQNKSRLSSKIGNEEDNKQKKWCCW